MDNSRAGKAAAEATALFSDLHFPGSMQMDHQQQSEEHSHELRKKLVVIDSRDRDHYVHPKANSYEIRLDDELIDVVSMKIIIADLPFSAYMIGSANARVPFTVDGGPVMYAMLEPGDYSSPAEMAEALSQAMTSSSNGSVFTATYIPRTDNFEIVAQVPFLMAFHKHTGTAARVLGFSPCEDYPSSNGKVRSPYRKDFGPNRYIVLSVSPSAELISSTNNPTNRSFAIIPRKITELNIDNSDESHEKTWTPPIPRFSRIKLEYTDYDGNPYDFQNQDHHIELQFTCLRHHRKYAIH